MQEGSAGDNGCLQAGWDLVISPYHKAMIAGGNLDQEEPHRKVHLRVVKCVNVGGNEGGWPFIPLKREC